MAAALLGGAAPDLYSQSTERTIATPRSSVPVERTVVARGLKNPWSMAFLPGGGMLITEKNGGLVHVDSAGRVRAIAGVPVDFDTTRRDVRDNTGLFDVVLHPEFARSRLLYLAYASRGEGGTTTKLVRARLAGDRLEDVQTLFEATPRSDDRFHYGGGLVIGPDRKLYLTVGERHFRESDNPPIPVAQDPSDRRGKIYRFNLDGTVPADNPSFGPGAPAGMFALGIRAAQGLAVQPGTGRIWFSDHGSVRGDEINVLAAGANYGWPNRTSGMYRDTAYRPPPSPNAAYREPAHMWRDRTVAPTGMTFYTGAMFPEWRGNLFVAGLRRGYLMNLRVSGERVVGLEYLLEDAPVRLRNVKQGPDGALYVLTDQPDGSVIRISRAGSAPRAGMR